MKRLLFALLLVLTNACGGGGSSTGPSSSVQSPTITTTNTMIYVGQTVQFAATGAGTIRWGTDSPSVASVDVPSGRVTGTGTGRATIWAENERGRTTRLLRGLPSYAGNWSGTYALTGCQSTGDLSLIGFCGNFSQGQVLNMDLQISQTEDRVSGLFAFGGNAGTLNSSTVSETGQLPLTGLFTSSNGSITMQNARFESSSPGTITGSFDQSWAITNASGFGILSCVIRNVTRTSGGPTLFQRPSGVENISIDEMIRRVFRK